MSHLIIAKRPTARSILDQAENWQLNHEDLNDNFILDKMSNIPKLNENIFYSNFLQQKRNINENYQVELSQISSLKITEPLFKISCDLSKDNKYSSISLIGVGAFGKIFKVKEKLNSDLIALKIIKPVQEDSEYIEKMKREIDILRDVEHNNIVKYYSSHTDANNYIYIEMELCTLTLKDMIIDFEKNLQKRNRANY